jgi:glutaredoxin-related protein|tara:strand:+ start:195 stop:443 length:249 start_codon:yes stop_codon:yes gene_type:complete
MKKIILLSLILFSSCSNTNKIYYSNNVKKCIHNLEEMQRWLHEDYDANQITQQVANNYMIVVINTKCSLYKKIKENNTDCQD